MQTRKRSNSSSTGVAAHDAARPKLNTIHNHQEKRSEPRIVSHEEWLKERKALLQKEKELSRHLDEVVKARQELAWEKIGDYTFQGPNGAVKLSELFGDKKELVIQHVMFSDEEEKACPMCSLWLDNFNGVLPHIRQKAAFYAVAKAHYPKLQAFQKLKGYGFDLLSSADSTFNLDLGVEQPAGEPDAKWYNYGAGWTFKCNQYPGVSVFHKGDNGEIYHTYSCYSRGLDILNAFHAFEDLLPHGRDGFFPKHKESY